MSDQSDHEQDDRRISQLDDDPSVKEIVTYSRKMEFDKGIPLSFDFCKNEVNTAKYSFPIQLFNIIIEMFKRPIQILLVFLCIIYLISLFILKERIEKLEIFWVFVVQIFLFFFEVFYELIDYFKIIINDKNTNNQKTQVYNHEQKCFVTTTWKEVRVGQIIKLSKDEIVPADMIILETLDTNHVLYIDESSVTGVFDAFKVKRSCNDTQTPANKTIKINEYIKNIKGMLKYEEPNADLESFNGKLKLESYPRSSEIKIENFVMRGTSIKHIKNVYGLVVYTGMETKIMQIIMNDKRNSILKRKRNLIGLSLIHIQYISVLFYIFCVFLYCIMNLAKTYSFIKNYETLHYLGSFTKENIENLSWNEYFISIIKFSFTIYLYIPYIWFNMIHIAYLILQRFIYWDTKIRKQPKNAIDIIHNDCLADFGQIKYILTDKTGTLTRRRFLLKSCLIGKKFYMLDPLDKTDENYIFRSDDNNWRSKMEIYNELEKEREVNDDRLSLSNKPISTFLEYLCLCHSVKIRKKENIFVNSDKVFGASFADEKAILKVLKNLGYSLNKTKNDKIILEINGETKQYYIVGRNNYSEQRQRMSIIIKKQKADEESLLLCKGSSISMLELLYIQDDNRKIEFINQIEAIIEKMSSIGYRYYIICTKRLSEDITNSYILKHKKAENNSLQREELLEELSIEFEYEMEFQGLLFFEEEFADDLRYSLDKLDKAGIKTWIVSGDRKDNVIAVAKNLEMVNTSNLIEFLKEDKIDDLEIKMNVQLMQYIAGDKEKEEVDDNVQITEKGYKKKKIKSEEDSLTAKKQQNKDLYMYLDGEAFTIICKNTRLFQSFTILLAFTKGLFGFSFSPKNKNKLIKIMQTYVRHNSKVLAIGDGLNDLMMLKEADLSIGIRSKEILQVKNTCDVIISHFSQITDLILVHGTWNLHRIYKICFFSFYATTLIVFFYFYDMRSSLNRYGSVFSELWYLILTIHLLIINFNIIIIICFDQNIERTVIGVAPYIYSENYISNDDRIYDYITTLLKGIFDSLLIYYIVYYCLDNVHISYGPTLDKLSYDLIILYSSYILLYMKLVILYMNIINVITVITALISFIIIIATTFIGVNEFIILNEILINPMVIITIILSVLFCFFIEFTFNNIKFLLNTSLTTKLVLFYKEKVENYSLFINFNESIKSLARVFDSKVLFKEKTNFNSVSKNLHKTYKILDSVIENNYNMENHKVAELKLTNMLSYYDLKLENDYIPYMSHLIFKSFVIYYIVHICFFIFIVIIKILQNRLYVSKIGLILQGAWISFGVLFLLVKSFKYKLKEYSVLYCIAGLIFNIVSIYKDDDFNDLKIGVLFIIHTSFPLFFCLRKIKWIFVSIIFYIIAISPSFFIDSNAFISKPILNYYLLGYDSSLQFMQLNIGLLISSFILTILTLLILSIYGYNEEKYSRINFLKINHKLIQFKKDQEIFDNLVPKFIQEKMTSSNNRGASVDEEIVTILFADIQDFDGLVTKMSSKEFITLLDKIYSTFDQLSTIHGLQKIETVGKTYMAAGGLKECEKDVDPVVLSKHHSVRTFELGLDMLDMVSKVRLENGDTIKLKIGIHTREVNSAVVGNHKPQFSLVGDTVNTTARMCAYSKENCIHITTEAYEEISKSYHDFEEREIEVKGKGTMKTYLFHVQKKDEKEDKEKKKNIVKQRGKDDNQNNNDKMGEVDEFIIDYSGNDKEKKNNEFNIYEINDDINKSNNLLFQNLFLSFKDEQPIVIFKDKSEKPSVLYRQYSEHKYKTNIHIATSINFIYILGVIFQSFFFTYYKEKNTDLIDNDTVIGCKLFVSLILFMMSSYIKNNNEQRKIVSEIVVFLSYLAFIIILQVQFKIYDIKYLIFIEIEQNLTVISALFNGVLSHLSITVSSLLYIIAFAITAGIGNSISHDLNINYTIIYSIVSIFLVILFYIFHLFREYLGSFEFLENKKHIEELKDREKLLFNLMPPTVVQRLKDDMPVIDDFDHITILYTDIAGFTAFSKQSTPKNVVKMLIELFRRFDDAVLRNDVYKVHTIGDCYVILGYTGKVIKGDRDPQEEAMKVINIGKDMISIIKDVAASREVNFSGLGMRIGIHTGSITAGIIGTKIVRYDIFGIDNVIANKMESEGETGKVNISEDTKRLIEDNDLELPFTTTYHKTVQVNVANRNIKCFLCHFDDNKEPAS